MTSPCTTLPSSLLSRRASIFVLWFPTSIAVVVVVASCVQYEAYFKLLLKPNEIDPIGAGPVGVGNTVRIDFCTSCSYKGTAVTVKNMLESLFPGINVVLANYPPPLPKRVLSKVIPVIQTGIIIAITAGDQIFPRLGVTPPQLYHSLRANKFRSIASIWLLSNFVQSFLQSSGAFEVYFNGELVFSKLKENRFPGEFELKELIGKRIGNTHVF